MTLTPMEKPPRGTCSACGRSDVLVVIVTDEDGVTSTECLIRGACVAAALRVVVEQRLSTPPVPRDRLWVS